MTEYTIFTDIHIAKAKKVHVVCTEAYKKHSWHQTVIAALEELADAGVWEAMIVGESKCFRVSFNRDTAPKMEPILTGHEGY